jgi:hypothetical protein
VATDLDQLTFGDLRNALADRPPENWLYVQSHPNDVAARDTEAPVTAVSRNSLTSGTSCCPPAGRGRQVNS